MKTGLTLEYLTIEYLPSIGSYLDELGVTWHNNGNDTITIEVSNIKHAFEIGRGYEQFMLQLENND